MRATKCNKLHPTHTNSKWLYSSELLIALWNIHTLTGINIYKYYVRAESEVILCTRRLLCVLSLDHVWQYRLESTVCRRMPSGFHCRSRPDRCSKISRFSDNESVIDRLGKFFRFRRRRASVGGVIDRHQRDWQAPLWSTGTDAISGGRRTSADTYWPFEELKAAWCDSDVSDANFERASVQHWLTRQWCHGGEGEGGRGRRRGW